MKAGDSSQWQDSIRKQMEDELARRVRDALQTPPLEKLQRRRRTLDQQETRKTLENLNAHVMTDLEKEEQGYKYKRWKVLRAKHLMQNMMSVYDGTSSGNGTLGLMFKDEQLCKSNQDEFPGVFGLGNLTDGAMQQHSMFGCFPDVNGNQFNNVDGITNSRSSSILQAALLKQSFTKTALLDAIRTGNMPDGSSLSKLSNGRYVDKYGIVRTDAGPFWPLECTPLFAAPKFIRDARPSLEPLSYMFKGANPQTTDNQVTRYDGRWRGVLIVYDSERSPRDQVPTSVNESCCPSLMFESRFECGNLRQARRTGQFEYELMLTTDVNTNRHTQWYYFRVQNALPGVTYKLRIVNLLKRDSLYNQGMRPLLYSEKEAKLRGKGWMRAGHHIGYFRNVMHLHCPLLLRGIAYFMLEWQMEFPHADDVCYLAQCYPYTFTDLCDDLDLLMNTAERRAYVKRDILCETKAGNSCFLLTVTDNDISSCDKKGVVITGRVHPGETNASWLVKGVLDFITGDDPVAKELRRKFIFKIVPMLNPDGVIVGNYRCSLMARDLNRNYRHPRCTSFPTVWHTKSMIEAFAQEREIILYCDLHGHSRKQSTFMYGNSTGENCTGLDMAKRFIADRTFPWLMALRATPGTFSFPSSKFHIRRCKESTGRVIMWRQMNIANSFTLEASFCGTSADRTLARHFNILDFQEIGHCLCATVLDFHKLQENQQLKNRVIYHLTQYITRQVLERRGIMINKMSGLRMLLHREASSHEQSAQCTAPADVSGDGSQDSGTESFVVEKDADFYGDHCYGDRESNADLSMAAQPSPRVDQFNLSGLPIMHLPSPTMKPVSSNASSIFKQGLQSNVPLELPAISSRSEHMFDAEPLIFESAMVDYSDVPMKAADNCMAMLSQLNIQDILQDSDSSDSDTESEPDFIPKEGRNRRKKRKSKKTRDRAKTDPVMMLSKKKDDDLRPTTVSNDVTLNKGDRNYHPPLFTSKFEGRHNNGIPCFAKERSVERAAKRLAEMRRRIDDSRREISFYYPEAENELPEIVNTLSAKDEETIQPRSIAFDGGDPLSGSYPRYGCSGSHNITQTLLGQQNRNCPYRYSSHLNEIHLNDLTPSIQPLASLSTVLDESESETSSDSDPEDMRTRTTEAYQESMENIAKQFSQSHTLLAPTLRRSYHRSRTIHVPRLSLQGKSNITTAPTIPSEYRTIYTDMVISKALAHKPQNKAPSMVAQSITLKSLSNGS